MSTRCWAWGCVILLLISVNCSVSSSDSGPIGQKKLDQVGKLPGQHFNVEFAHYAGYVTVNQESGRALFYWLTEAVEEPASKPLVLWLNGGPGCSSVGYGMAEEVGPFHVDKDGKSVYLNPYSWNNVVNLLFLDSPVGVGYSYTNTSSEILNNGDKRTAADSLEFLLNWLERFPEYKGRDFYLTGESYAGHYVPQLSQAIVRYNKANVESPINLKGYMVGNAVMDDCSDQVGRYQYYWSMGMISDQTYNKLMEACTNESFGYFSDQCSQLWDTIRQEFGNIDMYSIFTPPCTANPITRRLFKGRHNVGRSYDPCSQQHSTIYFNLPQVQNVLHVYRPNASRKWEVCSDDDVEANWKDKPTSVLDVYQELLGSGLRIWIYSGNADAVVPVPSTRHSINALKLPTISPWRAWYDEGQVGGWTQEYQGLTYVTVRGAGHEVPLHKPKQALTLFNSFLAGTSMPTFELDQLIRSKTSVSEQVNAF